MSAKDAQRMVQQARAELGAAEGDGCLVVWCHSYADKVLTLAENEVRRGFHHGTIDRAWDTYLEVVEAEAKRRFEAEVLPFAKRRGWEFLAGNGDFSFFDPTGKTHDEQHVYAPASEHQDDDELQTIWKMLSEEVPGLRSNDFGSMMPSWPAVK